MNNLDIFRVQASDYSRDIFAYSHTKSTKLRQNKNTTTYLDIIFLEVDFIFIIKAIYLDALIECLLHSDYVYISFFIMIIYLTIFLHNHYYYYDLRSCIILLFYKYASQNNAVSPRPICIKAYVKPGRIEQKRAFSKAPHFPAFPL